MIYYDEPVAGVDADLKRTTCNRRVSMTNDEAICIQRAVFFKRWQVGPKRRATTFVSPSEDDLLDEFMVIHWAKEET